MTAATTQPLTAARLLFDEGQDTRQALAQALDHNGVLGSLDTALRLLSQAGRQAADNQVAAAAHSLLDLDMGGMFAAGWRKQGELVAAAERTAADPGSSEVVQLASHRISSVHRPFVDLIVDGVPLATINFELDLAFLVRVLVATVRGGHIVGLHSGSCEATATLAAEGVLLARRQASFELPLVIRWPLLLHRGGGADPLPSGTEPPPARPGSRQRGRSRSLPGGPHPRGTPAD
jgi:hypothetical protein